MIPLNYPGKHVHHAASFDELVTTAYQEEINAICWDRQLAGDFSEIVDKIVFHGNMTVVEETDLLELSLSEQGQIAREILLSDLKMLREYGASPVLNVIRNYERDDEFLVFPTDVYSFHVDRSPIPTDTFLCTYYGAASELVSNTEARQKVVIPEIRSELRKLFDGPEGEFEAFLSEHFFDLHYHVEPDVPRINLGLGNLWRIAVDHPESKVLPCVHRAPMEKKGESRLLLIS